MKILSVLMLGTNLLTPISDEVPPLDVAASCKAAAEISLVDSQIYDSCLKEEFAARDQLMTSWLSFPAADRASCSAEASTAGAASYVDFLVCLQIAQQLEREKQTQLKGASVGRRTEQAR